MKWEGEFPPAPPLEVRFANRFDSAWSKEHEENLLEIIAAKRRLQQMEMRLWAVPIDWLESLPGARWWMWLRENFQVIIAMLFFIGSLWGSWYLWKWFVRALVKE